MAKLLQQGMERQAQLKVFIYKLMNTSFKLISITYTYHNFLASTVSLVIYVYIQNLKPKSKTKLFWKFLNLSKHFLVHCIATGVRIEEIQG